MVNSQSPLPPLDWASSGGNRLRNGHRVFDADTHMQPMAEAIEPYLTKELREGVPDLEARKVEFKTGWAGEKLEPPFRHMFSFRPRGGGWGGGKPRVLGEAGPRENAE